MTIDELLTAIDTWRAAEIAYIAAYRKDTELRTLASGDECERAKDILNEGAENVVGIARHKSTAFETVTTLADEIRRLQAENGELRAALEPFANLFSVIVDTHEYDRNDYPLYVMNDIKITVEDVNLARAALKDTEVEL